MQLPIQAPASTLSPLWTQIEVIATCLCFLIGGLDYFGLKPRFRSQRGVRMKSEPKGLSLWVGILFTFGFGSSGFTIYSQFWALSPERTIAAEIIIFLLVIVNWILVWRSPRLMDSASIPLSPLQVEVLTLSRDLTHFLKDAGSRPELNDAGPKKDGENLQQWNARVLSAVRVYSEADAEWSRKLIYRYKEQYADRVKRLMHSLAGATGMVVFPLETYTTDVRPGDDFQNLIDILMHFFVKLENPKVRPIDNVTEQFPATAINSPPSRLKILSANYGIEGINDPDVKHSLLKRLHGDAFAEPIGADLFDGLDPVSGKEKRLTVRYSFDGKEATIVRPEGAWLILPEDTFLSKQVAELQREIQRVSSESMSISVNGVLVAGPAAHAEERARQESAAKPLDSVLSLLQVDALNLRKDLIAFLKEFGPEPTCDTSDCLNDPDLNARRLTEYHNKVVPFRNRLRSMYALRFKERATVVYHRFAAAGISDIHFASLSDTADSVQRLEDLINTLWTVAGQVREEPNEKD